MKDYFNYTGKVCVVAGASSGIGKATAEMLLDLGAEVIALDWAETDLPGIKQYIKINVGDKHSIDEAFAALPSSIDKFFGVAGVSGQRHSYEQTLCINFVGYKYMIETYLLHRMTDNGAMAFISSNGGTCWEYPQWQSEYRAIADAEGWDKTIQAIHALGDINSFSGQSAYNFSKRMLNYYLIKMVPAFARRKIRINAVQPSSTNTGLKADFVKATGSETNLVKLTGLAGRLAEPREMCEPLVFLNSEMASYISGIILSVDWGFTSSFAVSGQPNPFNKSLLPTADTKVTV